VTLIFKVTTQILRVTRLLNMVIGDAGERRRLLLNAFYFGLWKELLLLAVTVILCKLVVKIK
jgi:hypothetical protein